MIYVWITFSLFGILLSINFYVDDQNSMPNLHMFYAFQNAKQEVRDGG